MAGPYDKRPVPLPPRDRDPLGYGRRREEPTLPQTTQPPSYAQGFDPDADLRTITAPPRQTDAGPTAPAPPPPQPEQPAPAPPSESGNAGLRGDLYADPASARDPAAADAPIVPAGSVTGRSLTLVIAIMCFFASLTAGAVYLMNQSASAWLRNVASEVTIQIEPRQGSDIEQTLLRTKRFLDLRNAEGVAQSRILSLNESRALLEPWLGSGALLEDLPIPRIIAVQLDRSRAPDLDRIRRGLSEALPNEKITIDDHRRWQQQIRAVTTSFALGGLGILLLVGAATTAIIVSATRSAMLSNREIVEVLHFIGATDRFIAREFEKHFLTLGIRAGLVGAAFAIAVFLTMPLLMQLFGGATVTGAELRRLIGTGSLDMPGYLLIGIVVVVIAALCMLTSRFGVYRILNSQN